MESELFGHEKGAFTGADRLHRGCFERASGGTLFLDEVTEMPAELQVKLLRVLETGSVERLGAAQPVATDVRLLAATNRDPAQAVAQGKLREDLYYRLNVFRVDLPPLRARLEDVEPLALHFIQALNEREGTKKVLTPAAVERLRAQPWPGNVRELKNAVERAFVLGGDEIGPACVEGGPPLPGPGSADPADVGVRVGMSLADAERRLIEATLARCEGQKPRAAEMLGISLKTLYNRLHEYKAAEPEA
jgi:DNA-binding NtrC family response regulator